VSQRHLETDCAPSLNRRPATSDVRPAPIKIKIVAWKLKIKIERQKEK
jgi:hypothetical protein